MKNGKNDYSVKLVRSRAIRFTNFLQNILLWIIIGFSASVSAEEFLPVIGSRAGNLIQTYCVTCHNETLRTGSLSLDQVILDSVDKQSAVWEKVVRKLQTGAMPPQGLPRPTPDDNEYLINHLETELDRVAVAYPNPGRTAPHRLNRAEYANAVRDIFDLEINVEKLFPPDATSSHGFDNLASVLSLSPVLMEGYLSAAKTISRLAVGDPDSGRVIETYTLPDNLNQQDRASEEHPFGARGGIIVRHYFPVDGEYVIRTKLKRIEFGIDAGKITGFEVPKQMEVMIDGIEARQFSLGGQQKSDEDLDVRISVKAGMRSLGVFFLRDRVKAEEVGKEEQAGGVVSVEVEGPYNLSGVGDTPSRRKIFSCYPDDNSEETSCAKEILSRLARNAYRRPVTDKDTQPLVGLFQAARKEGGFDAAIGMAIQGILVSPKFLFRVEDEPADVAVGSAYPISDIELASRISFFLWSSVPDETLLDLATRGKLRDPEVMEQQVRRMMKDPRSVALVDNFATQWLRVRNLDLLSPPDPEVYPEYDQNLKIAFENESKLFFEYIINEDRSVLEFLTANYTFLNERLAKHYGISGVHGNHFRRVSLTGNEQRWGLLGKGSILTVTSYATRTSPTLRGKWVLDSILGIPPPPPPPFVPSLKDDAETRQLSMRERMEMHRSNPVCATCHRLMDPLGLALENFDAIGGWRDLNLDKTPVDASGQLPNGTTFEGPAQLREALWQQREQFVGTFIQRVLTYALGRAVEPYDMSTVRRIMHEAAQQDYRWSSIVMAIVNSQPFQMRRSAEL